jgi:hypothetical protein
MNNKFRRDEMFIKKSSIINDQSRRDDNIIEIRIIIFKLNPEGVTLL